MAAVALHSLALGTAMTFWPVRTLTWCGWEYQGDDFFPAQSGVFLLLLGGAYAAGVWHRPFAWFLVASKAVAVVFLVAEGLRSGAPGPALLAGVLDGAMGLAALTALIVEARGRRSRPAGAAPTEKARHAP